MKKIKIILIFLICIGIIAMVISLYFFLRDRKFVEINDENIEFITKELSRDIENEKKLEGIRKVGYQMIWLGTEIEIYYAPFEKIKSYPTYEGAVGIGTVAEYVRENGYSESTIALKIIYVLLIAISICIVALIVIYRIEKSKNGNKLSCYKIVKKKES